MRVRVMAGNKRKASLVFCMEAESSGSAVKSKDLLRGAFTEMIAKSFSVLRMVSPAVQPLLLS